MVEIITHYSGDLSVPPEVVDGNGDRIRILLLLDDGSTKEIFRGSAFSEEDWQKNMGRRNRRSYLEEVKKG